MNKTQAELDFMHNFRHETDGAKWAKNRIEEFEREVAELKQHILSVITHQDRIADKCEELEQERDEWKARTEFSFGVRDQLSEANLNITKERDQLREQVRMLRTDLKTAADYLDQTAACNSDKAISIQFRKTLAATEPKP